MTKKGQIRITGKVTRNEPRIGRLPQDQEIALIELGRQIRLAIEGETSTASQKEVQAFLDGLDLISEGKGKERS